MSATEILSVKVNLTASEFSAVLPPVHCVVNLVDVDLIHLEYM